MWRIWISRALALIATAGAAVALVGLTTGSWATCTLYGLSTEYGNYQVDRNRHLDLELHPDGRLAVHGDQSLQQLYDDGKNAALREALTHAIPGMLDGFANACVVAIGLLAAVGI